METIAIMDELGRSGLDVYITHYDFSGSAWRVDIKQKTDNVRIEITADDEDFRVAVRTAYNK